MGDLYTKLKEYAESDYYPYHMPGHKRRLGGEALAPFLPCDITEIEGFDNLHDASAILRDIQKKAARICGAEESHYLVNGSTSGILSALSAALPKGGTLLMARGCHRSAYHAVYLRELQPVYLWTEVHPQFECQMPVTADEVEQALNRYQEIQAVLIVSPTYEGLTADVAAIAAVVHRHGIPLIVDEAHGAHLGFHPCWAQNSIRQGADLVIQSLHKTLPAPTQTAILHVSGDLINRDRLRRFLAIYQSSSPSYPFMAAMEEALDLAEKQGQTLFEVFRKNWEKMLNRLKTCSCLTFLQEKNSDAGKLVIMDSSGQMNGQELYERFLHRYHLQMEMAAGKYVLAMFTVGDSEEGYERLTQAILEIDRECERKSREQRTGEHKEFAISVPQPEAAVSLCDAWDGQWEWQMLSDAEGRTSAEFIHLYPPGIPLIAPGEIFDRKMCDCLLEYEAMGLRVSGVNKADGGYRVKALRQAKDIV